MNIDVCGYGWDPSIYMDSWIYIYIYELIYVYINEYIYSLIHGIKYKGKYQF